MDEPAHKSRTLPWTAGNLPPDADLSMIGNIMRMGVDERTAKEFVTGKKANQWNSDEQHAMEQLKKYGRDVANHVTEVYSPPRVKKMTRIINLIPGMAFDLTQVDEEDGMPWDFNVPAKRNKARTSVQSERPLLLIGSPMCAAFSQLQRVNFATMNKERAE